MKIIWILILLLSSLAAKAGDVQPPPGLVINIAAAVSGDPVAFAGQPLRTNLSAGVYRITVVSPEEDSRASYREWSASINGSIITTAFSIARQTGAETRETLFRFGGGRFGELTLDQRTQYFTNTAPGELLFGVGDQILYDNSGGVSVRLELLAPALSIEESVTLRFDAPSGVLLQLQGSTPLAPADWTDIGAPFPGDGLSHSVCQPLAGIPYRFFRLAVVERQSTGAEAKKSGP
jgi:hypothetical protein